MLKMAACISERRVLRETKIYEAADGTKEARLGEQTILTFLVRAANTQNRGKAGRA